MRDSCPKCGSHTALGDYRCFKCGYKQQRFTSHLSDRTGGTQLPLPDDILFNPNNFHPDAIEWLAKAHVFNDIIVKQGIGYCPDIHKVFLPAYDSQNVLKFYQLRTLDKDSMDSFKYLTYGKSSDYLIHYNDDQTNTSQIIIVEDHLSAMRLRKFGNVVALSGTFLSNDGCLKLVYTYRTFIFWLDPDTPGRQAMFKTLKRLKYFADKNMVKCLFSNKDDSDYGFFRINYDTIKEDPKCFSDSAIENILKSEVVLCEKP